LTCGKAGHITKSVEALDGEDFEAFARWFAELQADRWDRQIEATPKPASWTGWLKEQGARWPPAKRGRFEASGDLIFLEAL